MSGHTPKTHHFLLELGVEEMPPGELLTLSSALAGALAASLDEHQLSHGTVDHFESPRRLAVSIASLSGAQADSVDEQLGPPVGNERARVGFARRHGVAADALEQVQSPKGLRWAMRRHRAGRAAIELLPELVEAAVAALPTGRRMRWGAHAHTFVRPVRWVVMLLDDTVLDATVLGCRAGRETRGHRVHAQKPIALAHAGEYLDTLRSRGHVLACSAERRARIEQQLHALESHIGGQVDVSAALLAEITAMVEWPVALAGRFDQRFLALPDIVIATVMRKHQKYFPVRDAQGQLLALFVTVANLASLHPELIVTGNERVLQPRLADAEFFLREDQQRPLASYVDDLSGLDFHAALGSMREKNQRVAALSEACAPLLGADPAAARRAGSLAKADLSTLIVQELPELQGAIGGHYATASGESDAVAAAIGEHYHPRFSGDALPAGAVGQAVALADRMDTLVGILGNGHVPDGSGDPFALRRAAIGVLRIAVEAGHDLDLPALCELARRQYDGVDWPADPVSATLNFFKQRSRAYFEERGVQAALLRSVIDRAATRPFDAQQRIAALARFLQRPEAGTLIAANKRIANILRPLETTPPPAAAIREDLLGDGAERRLHAAAAALRQSLPPLLQRADYDKALAQLAALHEALSAFFEQVLVMAEERAVRDNRIALLAALSRDFAQIADFSALASLAASDAAGPIPGH